VVEGGFVFYMYSMNDKVSRALEVPLRAFCFKARGGGGRLRQATDTEGKKKRRR